MRRQRRNRITHLELFLLDGSDGERRAVISFDPAHDVRMRVRPRRENVVQPDALLLDSTPPECAWWHLMAFLAGGRLAQLDRGPVFRFPGGDLICCGRLPDSGGPISAAGNDAPAIG